MCKNYLIPQCNHVKLLLSHVCLLSINYLIFFDKSFPINSYKNIILRLHKPLSGKFDSVFPLLYQSMTAKSSKPISTDISPEKRYKANKRERARMLAINVAYDRLRNSFPIPQIIGVYGDEREDCDLGKKLSKIETLRLACNYIQLLKDTLERNKKMTKLELIDRLSLKIPLMTSNYIKNRWIMDQDLMKGLIELGVKEDENRVED